MEAKLTFLGATRNVTGSSILLEAGGRRLLVDCGLYQEREYQSRNWNPFPAPPPSIAAVLLTHAHLDHCGLLPKLVREGFRGRILCTRATAEIARVMLFDAAAVQAEDAEFKRKRHQREGRQGRYPEQPLYGRAEVEQTLPLFSAVEYGQEVPLDGGLEAAFFNAGHVLGSAIVRVRLKGGAGAGMILFSGDLGRWDRPIIEDPVLFEEADYVLMESTYGDRFHEPAQEIEEKLCAAVKRIGQSGGNLVVPSFALERSQELLYYLNKLLLEKRIPSLPVFVDSPMAVSVTKIFEDHPELFDREMKALVERRRSPFHFPGLRMVGSREDSKAINQRRDGAVIIAGSGMCTGGRIKHHLLHNVSRPESTILFVGYQAAGTLGREILEKPRELRILGQTRPLRAEVDRIGGFSAHADRGELLRWLSAFKRPPRRLFLLHGEPEACASLMSLLEREKAWEVAVPGYREAAALFA